MPNQTPHHQAALTSPLLLPLLSGLATCLLMTGYETLKGEVFGELTLWQSHIITIMFTTALAITIAALLSGFLRRHVETERLAEERQHIYADAMLATTHYLGNVLTSFQLLEVMLENDGKIDPESFERVKQELEKTARCVRELAMLENPSRENIRRFIEANLQTRA